MWAWWEGRMGEEREGTGGGVGVGGRWAGTGGNDVEWVGDKR